MQDYEYYEAHAKDVKLLKDITSDEYNADILASLRDNDPERNYISITTTPGDWGDFDVSEGNHLGWLGYFVGKSEKLDTLYIDKFQGNINLNAFFEGLRHNRSIGKLEIGIDLGESFHRLIPFLRNNDSLRHLNFCYFDIGLQCARNIALLLDQSSSLRRLDFEVIDFNDEGVEKIAAALRLQPRIEELSLSSNTIGRNGFVALGNALEGCLSLRKLDLTLSDNETDDEGLIDDEGLHAIAEGLKHCHNLTLLNLYGDLMIAEEGSRSFSTLFQSDSCRLEVLDLNRMNIDDDGMAVLATGLASLPTLKRLNLRGTSIGDQGLQDLAEGLVNCNLDGLDLSGNMLMELVSGLRALGTLVRRRTSIRSLRLSNCSIMDEGLQSFVEGMVNRCNLTELDLSGNRLITANGLASLSSLLRTEHCSLCTLDIRGTHLSDDDAAVLANGLIGNKLLRNLMFSVTRITTRGWAAFSRLLCDTSSVNSTYLSNHTLLHIGLYYGNDDVQPTEIVEYRKFNKLSQTNAAAICKILRSHPDIDVTPLFEFNLKCLPLVLAWLENARPYLDKVNESSEVLQCRQLSAVNKFIRGMPLLAANALRSQKINDVQLQSKSRKRTIDQIY